MLQLLKVFVAPAMLVAVLTGAPAVAAAQDDARVEVFVGYPHLFNQRAGNDDVIRVNGLTPAQVRAVLGADVTDGRGRAGLTGFGAAATAYVTRRLGITGEFSANGGTEDTRFFGLPGSTRARAYQVLGGPHVVWANRTRLAPFARALAGAARVSATYRNPVATVVDEQTALALAFGGGLDVRVSRRASVRLVQAEYNPVLLRERRISDTTQVPFELKGIRRDNLRLSVGVVMRY